jgi:hypothetical protein
MLRYGLLGGTRPALPWEFFLTLGGSCLGAGALFAILFPLWSTYAWAGITETAAFAVAGGVLVAVGVVRRRRSKNSSRPPYLDGP